MKIEHWVEWLCPGAFFPEESNERVPSRDLDKLRIPKDVYAFTFHDIEILDSVDERGGKHEVRNTVYKSPRYIIGKVYTIPELEKLEGDYEILISNVSQYDRKSAVKTHLGNWQPLLNDDVVLDPKLVKFKKPIIYKSSK